MNALTKNKLRTAWIALWAVLLIFAAYAIITILATGTISSLMHVALLGIVWTLPIAATIYGGPRWVYGSFFIGTLLLTIILFVLPYTVTTPTAIYTPTSHLAEVILGNAPPPADMGPSRL